MIQTREGSRKTLAEHAGSILSLNSPPLPPTGHVVHTAITDLQGLVEGMEGVGTHQEERKDGAICRG